MPGKSRQPATKKMEKSKAPTSDAGRTLAPRLRGAAGGRTPAAARQRGGRRTADLFLRTVKDGCPNAGFGVVGGKGLRKPLPPAASRAGYQAQMLGRSRQPATKKMEKSKAPTSDAGRTLVPRLRGTAGVRTPAAARQRGGRGTLSARGSRVKNGCTNAGFGVVGGKGLRKPLPPAASRAGYQAQMLGRSRQPATKKMEKSKAPTSPPARGGKNRYRPTD